MAGSSGRGSPTRLDDLGGTVRARGRRRAADPAPLTQDEVAALAGTTRESANRALRPMVADGEIRIAARGRYVVRTRLRSVDDADPSDRRP